jgi:hypothetical protein
MRQIGRQFDLAAVRKLQISQTDAKPPLAAGAALDYVARADRKPAGETVCKGTHEYPPESNTALGNFPAPMSEHRDGSETAWQQAQISVDRCGQRSP